MSFPSDHRNFFAPKEFESLRELTLEQIEKDFRLQGIDLTFEDRGLEYPLLVSALSEKLQSAGLHESVALRPLLYQLDISEKYIEQEITGNPEESALLADAIIKRCFAKVVYRKRFQ
jgi:hypothetical protein